MTILFAMMTVPLMIFATLTVGLGNARQERRQAQNAADAAALAGAQDITSGDVSSAAVVGVIKSYVSKNYGAVSWTGCVDSAALSVLPDSPESCISWDADPPSTKTVRVAIPVRNAPTFFGGVVGMPTIAVTASASASVGVPSAPITMPCALCTLSDTNLAVTGITLQNGNIAVTGGAIYVGGSLTCGPQGTMTSTGNGVVGSIGSKCTQITPAATNIAAIADPLGSLPAAPDYSGLTAKSDCTVGPAVPGIYNNITGCVLTPGLYVIAGGTLGGSGLATLTGPGVTIFLTCGTASSPRGCNPGEAGGAVNLGGNGAVTLTACAAAPCVGGATPGMVLWFDRNNSSTLVAHGNALVNVVGTVYGKSVAVDVKGSPAGTLGTCLGGFCSQIVVRQVAFSGQGTLNVSYVPGSNVTVSVPATVPQLLG